MLAYCNYCIDGLVNVICVICSLQVTVEK